jgi:glucosamine--fructose-6-phosphate aminotransferase (isomerizing)
LSDSRKNPRDGGNSGDAGAHSLTEILSQPQCWEASLAGLKSSAALKEIEAQFGRGQEWLFVGCGSSYYVALAAAATMKAVTGRRASAIPASEILLYPELALPRAAFVPVLISRSGTTSEVLKAAEALKAGNVSSVAISCAKGQALEKLATVTLTLPADEQSTVMTRSFTSMLLALQFLAGRIAGNRDHCQALETMPNLAASAFETVPERIREFVGQHAFDNYVSLGHGPYYGLACEYGLKVNEMSLSIAQVFHSLEFRHGPKSAVTPRTLLTFLLSEQGYDAECDLLEEMKSLGGATLVVANRANERARAAADLLVELQLPLPEYARLAPSLLPGQLLALHTGLKKGLNPDSPRYLTRSVILANDGSMGSRKPEPVA